jgi:hypothetical protein
MVIFFYYSGDVLVLGGGVFVAVHLVQIQPLPQTRHPQRHHDRIQLDPVELPGSVPRQLLVREHISEQT